MFYFVLSSSLELNGEERRFVFRVTTACMPHSFPMLSGRLRRNAISLRDRCTRIAIHCLLCQSSQKMSTVILRSRMRKRRLVRELLLRSVCQTQSGCIFRDCFPCVQVCPCKSRDVRFLDTRLFTSCPSAFSMSTCIIRLRVRTYFAVEALHAYICMAFLATRLHLCILIYVCPEAG